MSATLASIPSTLPTCSTCRYCERVSAVRYLCHFNPPPFDFVRAMDWCGQHEPIAKEARSQDSGARRKGA